MKSALLAASRLFSFKRQSRRLAMLSFAGCDIGTSAKSSRGCRDRARSARGAMLADICLVVLWGASIPGLMWLGVAGGF